MAKQYSTRLNLVTDDSDTSASFKPDYQGNLNKIDDYATATDARLNNVEVGTPPLGVYLPPGWGAGTKAKLGTKAKIAVVGDSVTRGYYTSNLDTKSWPMLLKARLQSAYGNGGTGWKGVTDSQPWMSSAAISSISSYDAAGNLYALTGTWTVYGSVSFGIGGASITTSSAGSATITVNGTTVKIFTIGGNGTWNYSIDGGATVAGSVGSYTAVNAVTITGLSAGNHTVTVNWVSGTLYLNGISGENATGVVVDNFARYGALTSAYNNTDALKQGRGQGGDLYPANMVIYNLGLNDAAQGTPITVDQISKNLRGYLDYVRDGTTGFGTTDIMIVMSHVGKYDASNQIFQSYCDRLRGVAEAYGAAFVNIWGQWKNSYNLAAASNYWGNAVTIGASGSDSVHISDAGANAMYNSINGVFQAYVG